MIENNYDNRARLVLSKKSRSCEKLIHVFSTGLPINRVCQNESTYRGASYLTFSLKAKLHDNEHGDSMQTIPVAGSFENDTWHPLNRRLE